MILATIQCNFCGHREEITKDKRKKERYDYNAVDVPTNWASISPMIHIKGTPHGQGEEAKRMRKRRDLLRAKFKPNHVCPDCIEKIMTGKVSLKLEHHG